MRDPGGIQEISPGLRSVSDEYPGHDVQCDAHPGQGC